MRDPDSKPCGCFLWVECTCAEEAVSEIASLRADVARLTEERDALSAAYRDAGIERDSAKGRAADAESDLSDARALADSLADVLRQYEPGCVHTPEYGCLNCRARAALRAWEEARRG